MHLSLSLSLYYTSRRGSVPYNICCLKNVVIDSHYVHGCKVNDVLDGALASGHDIVQTVRQLLEGVPWIMDVRVY